MCVWASGWPERGPIRGRGWSISAGAGVVKLSRKLRGKQPLGRDGGGAAAGVISPRSNSRIFRGFGWRGLCAGRAFLALMNVGVTGWAGVGAGMKRSRGVNRRKIEQGKAEQTCPG